MSDQIIEPAAAARRDRWTAKGISKVTHPRFGAIVVPHASRLSALKNAAELWGVDWLEIRDAEVWAASPEDGAAERPEDHINAAIAALKGEGK